MLSCYSRMIGWSLIDCSNKRWVKCGRTTKRFSHHHHHQKWI